MLYSSSMISGSSSLFKYDYYYDISNYSLFSLFILSIIYDLKNAVFTGTGVNGFNYKLEYGLKRKGDSSNDFISFYSLLF